MKDLIEKVMVWNIYPKQNPPWEGWEYVPTKEVDVQKLAKACGFPLYEEVEDGCLQYCPNQDRFVIAIDGFVEEISEKEFVRILEELAK